MSTRTRPAAVLAAVVLAITLAGCGNDEPSGMGDHMDGTGQSDGRSDSSESGSGDVSEQHNDTDVAFAQQMIPHHRQALMMVAMVERRGESEELRDLAEQMAEVQADEIELMEDMLRTWDEDLPAGGSMGHGMSTMTDEQLDRLGEARGSGFDAMWAQMMIAHHEDAIRMSEAQLDGGENAEAGALAEDIIDAQTAEIEQLEDIARG